MSPDEDLRPFWWRAEETEPVFDADEVKRWPTGQFDRLRRFGLLRETEQASDVTCYNCGHPHGAEVFYLNEDLFGRTRPHIVCPDEGLIAVDFGDMRQWLVDRQVLVRALAAALEAAGPLEQIVPNRVWALGRRHLGGRFRDFVFVAGAARPDGPAVIASADRIGNSASPVILVPGKRPRHEQWKNPALPLFCMSEVALLGDDRLVLDLDYIKDALPRDRAASHVKTVRGVSVPDGARWEDLAVEVGDGALVASVGGMRTEVSFEDCRFGARGDVSLQALRLLAFHRGKFSPRSVTQAKGDKTPFKKQISLLRQRLKTIFPIEGEPITYEKATGEYRCTFRISLDSDPGFPKGNSWLDFRIEEKAGARIRVGVKDKEVFAASAHSPSGALSREAAERETRVWREYPLERLGLADGTRPTAEGQVLLDFLRNGGKLERRPDDMPLLHLNQRMREWTGVADLPFSYSDRKGVWIAAFDCASYRQQ
jgi:hypothetical protein